SQADVLLAVTTLSFDMGVLELELPLSLGAAGGGEARAGSRRGGAVRGRRGAVSGAGDGDLRRRRRGVEPLRPDGGDGLCARWSGAVERPDSDRAGDRQYASVRVGWSAGAAAGGG